MKLLSAVLMMMVLLISATQAMEGLKKQALYTSIQAIICGTFGILMGDFITNLKDKLDMITHYPSLVDNPIVITKLHIFFNLMQITQFSIIAIFLVINIFIIKTFTLKNGLQVV